jgi:hypothetical protein
MWDKSMLGWEIDVYRTDLESPPKKWKERRDFANKCHLASWLVGIGGTAWLDELVSDGKATLLSTNNGYPIRYRSTAGVILPIIAAGIPSGKNPQILGDDYVMPENWRGGVEIDADKIKDCNPGDFLMIDAMDQS